MSKQPASIPFGFCGSSSPPREPSKFEQEDMVWAEMADMLKSLEKRGEEWSKFVASLGDKGLGDFCTSVNGTIVANEAFATAAGGVDSGAGDETAGAGGK